MALGNMGVWDWGLQDRGFRNRKSPISPIMFAPPLPDATQDPTKAWPEYVANQQGLDPKTFDAPWYTPEGESNPAVAPGAALRNEEMLRAYQNLRDLPEITAQSLYESGRALLEPDYERTQRQNVSNLEAAGLATSGAGYSPSSQYGLTQEKFVKLLGDLALQSASQAPVINQHLFGSAWDRLNQAAMQEQGIGERFNNMREGLLAEERANSYDPTGDILSGLFGVAGQIGGAAMGRQSSAGQGAGRGANAGFSLGNLLPLLALG